MNKVIATLTDPNPYLNSRLIIRKTNVKYVFETKIEFLDDNGKVESTTIGWRTNDYDTIYNHLVRHFRMPNEEADYTLCQ